MDDAKITAPPIGAKAPPPKGVAGRTQRLADALRDNLRRRKAATAGPRPARPRN